MNSELSIIDAHMHLSRLAAYTGYAAERSGVDYSLPGYRREAAPLGIDGALGMGLTGDDTGSAPGYRAETPMMLTLSNEIPRGVRVCAGINPFRLTLQDLDRLASVLAHPRCAGVKLYPGYYPAYVHDHRYEPVFDLAEQYGKPVAVHCGDTFAPDALLKYSHPIHLDQTAVRRRNIRFVICHLGNPWLMDAAAVIFKNWNVSADLSGLITGSGADIQAFAASEAAIRPVREALAYIGDDERIMFGTDWPLTPLSPYIDLVKSLVPERSWRRVFRTNAERLYGFETGAAVRGIP